MCSPCLLSRLAFIQAHGKCASFWPPISIIHDFTARRRGGPTPLVAFVDGVSPFSPTFAPAVAWKREETVERLQLHLRLPEKKEQVKWKWQSANIPGSSCTAFAWSPDSPSPPLRDPCYPGTRTCRSQPGFHRQLHNLWAAPDRGSPQCALEKTPYAWKSPLSLPFVQKSFMGQHWALWGLGDFPWDSIEGSNPFRHGTNKKVLTCCFHIY